MSFLAQHHTYGPNDNCLNKSARLRQVPYRSKVLGKINYIDVCTCFESRARNQKFRAPGKGPVARPKIRTQKINKTKHPLSKYPKTGHKIFSNRTFSKVKSRMNICTVIRNVSISLANELN